MKSIIIILLIALSINAFSQAKRKVSRVTQQAKTPAASTTARPGNNQTEGSTDQVQPRETATDRYLNGPRRNNTSTQAGSSAGSQAGTSAGSSTRPVQGAAAGTTSPFVGGVHAAENAARRFDTTAASRNNVSNQSANATIAGGNDTTFNVNTTMSQGGVTTNSGAVDRSGQTQFGQTNWGNSRRTVGESQWTVPPPITASFNKDFPTSNNATWTRNNVDTTIFSARYKAGAQWVTSNYNSAGQRLDMRTEFPLVQPPAPVSVYMAKQPAGFRVANIYKLQVQGKPDVYEIETASGKRIYVNNDGMEVKY